MPPTKIRAQIIEHKKDAHGKYHVLLFKVLEPEKLAGRYGVAATVKSETIENIDGREYEIYLNATMIGPLSHTKPLDYNISAPRSKEDDFLEVAKRVK